MAGMRKAWNKAARKKGGRVKAKDYPKPVRAYARKHGKTYAEAADFALRHYTPQYGHGPNLSDMYKDALAKTPATREKSKGRRARWRQAHQGTLANRGARAFRRATWF